MNDTDTDKDKDDKGQGQGKDDKKKIPNSLIIYIKTRIPNYYKINYDPTMTVPSSKSHTVYFEPLIKYYENAVRNIPPTAPKDALYTQFFEAGEFDFMINRILSDFRYMQKTNTLQEANDKKIIDNNISITLNTLFKSNNLFYINKKPYTIVASNFRSNDWQVDKKPLDKLLSQFSFLTPKQVMDEANQEQDDIPEILRQGNLSASNLTQDENASLVATGLQNASTESIISNVLINDADAFIPQNKLPGVTEDMKRLYTEYLRKNIPINYSDTPDLARDPITISLLINPSDLLDFINTNKKTKIVELYSSFIASKISLQTADQNYTNACTELAIYKTKFDKEVLEIEAIATKTDETAKKIVNNKITYMEHIFKMADAVMEIYNAQKTYFVSCKDLLEELKVEYVNIIKYYEMPSLALKCIDNDLYMMEILINVDNENPQSVSYHENFLNFKKFYDNQLYKNQQELLNPQINYSEVIGQYTSKLLSIEKEQYEIYNFKLLFFYSNNQFDIWMLLFKSIESFVRFIKNETNNVISVSENAFIKLNEVYTKEQQDDFFKRTQSDGIEATKFDKKLLWYFVKSDGTKALPEYNPKLRTSQIIEDELFEKTYLNYVRLNVKAYDAIILYTYLLEILCIRHNRVYIAEENVNQLNLEYSLTLNQYYEIIMNNINNNNLLIPKSFLWETNKLNNPEYLTNRIKINDKASVIYRGRIKVIADNRKELLKSCELISKSITPNVSKLGFINNCEEILLYDDNKSKYQPKSSYWLQKTINNYDIQDTNDFIYNMNKAVKDAWFDRIIEDIEAEFYLDWIVYNTTNTDNTIKLIDSLYNSIAYGLNLQMSISDTETTNPYTETIDGVQQFTNKSLAKLVSENTINLDITSFSNVFLILQKILKIKFIMFEMFPKEDNVIDVGDIVLYKGHPIRVVNIFKNQSGQIVYELYDGYSEIQNVSPSDIKDFDKNVLKYFRIYKDNSDYSDDKYNDYMYLVLTETGVKLVQNNDKNVIVYADSVPIYIKYLIFNSCPDIMTNINKANKLGFSDFINVFTMFINERQERINENKINEDIFKIEEKLKEYRKEYKELKKIKDKTLEQIAHKVLLKEEIKDLKIELQRLKDTTNINNFTGGDIQYYPNMNPNMNPIMNPNMNPNMNLYMVPNYNYRYNYGYNQKPLPYNVALNKAKDQQSKLSFYTNIELELFPGTSVNPLQKSFVKCQNTFERIRESWAEIFGYQYRPAPMVEAYEYGLKPNNSNNVKN